MVNSKKLLISDLPSPIISDIISLLPTKSIMLCKFVCRHWCSLINHPHFRKSSKSISMIVRSDSNLLQLVEPEVDYGVAQINGNSCFLLGDNAAVKFNDRGFDGVPQRLKIVNSCNGLACLTPDLENASGYWDPFVVCNPVMSDYVVVKPPISAKMGNFVEEKYAGFGYSAKSGQYKIVRFFLDLGARKLMADVCTLGGDNEWRRLKNPPWPSFWLQLCLFYKGALHWIILSGESHTLSVVAFDCQEEVFSVMAFPGFHNAHLDLYSSVLSILNSRLCLGIGGMENVRDRFDIWVMNEYGVSESWERLFVVSPWETEGLVYLTPLTPFTYWCNGEIVMLSGMRGLISFNVTTKKWRVIEIPPGITRAIQADLFDPIFVPTKNLIMQGIQRRVEETE